MSLFLPDDEQDIPQDVTARDVLIEVRKLERRLKPAVDFYVRASAVLGFFRWAGPTTIIAIVAALVWALRPPVA